ncbi:hypothetical protein AGMMS49938_12270 [Fibrobacterales bacterium]|nr:hypothetical protein AGMMS49938_12270 [Fibrobacterales bacterium]
MVQRGLNKITRNLEKEKFLSEYSKSIRLFILAVVGLVFAVIVGIITVIYVRVQSADESTNTNSMLSRFVESQYLNILKTYDREVILTLKMANSPLIQQYLANPQDKHIAELAFSEIENYQEAFAGRNVSFISDTDKKYYNDMKYIYTVNPQDSVEFWYNQTLYETPKTNKNYNVNVDFNKHLNSIKFWINAPVFYKGKVVGMLGSGLSINDFVDNIMNKFGEDGDAKLMIANNKGEIVMAKNTKLIREKAKVNDYLDEYYGKSFREEINRERTTDDMFHLDKQFKFDGRIFFVKYMPQFEWTFMMSFNADSFDNTVYFSFTQYVILILILFFAFMLSFIFSNTLLNPILKFLNVVTKLFEVAPMPIVMLNGNKITHISMAMERYLADKVSPDNLKKTDESRNLTGEQEDGDIIKLLRNEPDLQDIFERVIKSKKNFEDIKEIKIGEERKYIKIWCNNISENSDEERLVILSDLTEQMMMATTDPLTGLANRREFNETCEKEFKKAVQEKLPISVLMLDIDHFKNYNDTYGHAQGDELLKAFANVIRDTANRTSDIVARIGGEEFAIILPNTNSNGAFFIAKKICIAVENMQVTIRNTNKITRATVSIGYYSGIPSDEEGAGESASRMIFEKYLLIADQNLYKAKESGRNRVEG